MKPFDPNETGETGEAAPVAAPRTFDPELEAALTSLEVEDVLGGGRAGSRPRIATGTTPPPRRRTPQDGDAG